MTYSYTQYPVPAVSSLSEASWYW